MKKSLKIIASVATSTLIVLLSPIAVQAASGTSPADVVREVDTATGPFYGLANPSIIMPAHTGQSVEISGTEAGAHLSITPELGGNNSAAQVGGTTVIGDSSNSVAIRPLSHGVQLMNVFTRADQNITAYQVSLPAGETLQLDPLGGVLVVLNGKWVGRFSAPWAVDAVNRTLPTAYTVTNNTITQTVNTTGAQFPIIADPHYTWGIVTGTVYFNKSETAHAAADSAFIAGIGYFAPPPFDALLVASAGYYALFASNAVIDHKCLEVKSTGLAYEYSGSRGDGYCM